jgi:peptidoglycan DL-endopeptidase CwlO
VEAVETERKPLAAAIEPITESNRAGHGHVSQQAQGHASGARNVGFVSMALVNLTATISLTAAPAQADEIDLDNADIGEISSHLEVLRQHRASEEEKLDLLETERSDLKGLIEDAESDLGTVEAQFTQATAALNAADGDLSDKVKALGDFRIEQAERYEATQRALERLESVEPEISRGTEEIERLLVDIGEAGRALEAAERAAQARATARTESPTATTAPAGPPDSANAVVQFAYDQLGKPYGFGKAGPGAYDCSGLVVAAYSQSGVSLSRTSQGQWNDSVAISRGDLSPGDLVFSYGTGHTSIYIGGNQVIHATKPGDTVKIASIDHMPVSSYRRVRA